MGAKNRVCTQHTQNLPMFQPNLFQGKTVLVTGGGSGIGQAIARQFLQCGATVFIGSSKSDRIQKALVELSPLGQVYGQTLDIRDIDQIAEMANFITEKAGKLDILINNAGGQFPSAAADISPKGWNAVVNTNLNGTWFVTQTMAQKFFFNQGEGVILNIVVNNYRGIPGMAHTGAARAGVMNLTKTLAVEWASRGIRINCIAPGIILSSGLDQYPPELVAGIERIIPMKRLGTVDEVAALTLFLSTPAAAYMTGDTVYMDGGARLWGDIWEI